MAAVAVNKAKERVAAEQKAREEVAAFMGYQEKLGEVALHLSRAVKAMQRINPPQREVNSIQGSKVLLSIHGRLSGLMDKVKESGRGLMLLKDEAGTMMRVADGE